MRKETLLDPRLAAVVGAFLGSVLLVLTTPALRGETLADLWEFNYVSEVVFEYLFPPIIFGGVVGALVGLALWVLLTGQRPSALYRALYWVFLAFVLTSAVFLAYAGIAGPQFEYGYSSANTRAARAFWSGLRVIDIPVLLVILPTSAWLGVRLGSGRAGGRGGQHIMLSSFEKWSKSGWHAVVVGTAYGAVLVSTIGVWFGVLDYPPIVRWKHVLTAGLFGGGVGAVVGLALWTALWRGPAVPSDAPVVAGDDSPPEPAPPRPTTHPLYLSLAWCVIGTVLSLPLFMLFGFVTGSGHRELRGADAAMAGIGTAVTYFFFVLPSCAVAGAVFGAIYGLVKRSREERGEKPEFRLEKPPQSRERS